MPAAEDLTGRTFGRYTVIGRGTTRQARGAYRWLCRCECGAVKEVVRADLVSAASPQCRSCAVATRPARVEAIRRRAGRLTEPIWPRTCPTCGTDYCGTARQVYCSRSCRPGRRRAESP